MDGASDPKGGRDPDQIPNTIDVPSASNGNDHCSLLAGDLTKPKDVTVVDEEGLWITLSNGHKYLNGSGGAAVASLGYRHPAMVAAVCDPKDLQVGDELLYPSGDSLGFADDLVATTGGKMYAASLYNSGSDAVEAAIKLAVQTQNSRGQGHRSVFIARENSYHGATGGALNVSGHLNRRNGNHALLRMDVEFVSPCNTYRDMVPGETEEQYVDRLAQELEGVFAARLGEVVAMIAEPVVGAALGCMGAPKGYLKRMQQICHKHGALFIVDEVMCGSGRSGKTFHVWQQEEDFVPDIQTLGKGLTGGYEAVGVIMATREVHDLVRNTDGEVRHGQTFQCFPRACRAGRAAIREILPRLSHVEEMGKLLKAGLKANLASHRYVGDIRGSGLFVAIELVMDKMTKVPFHRNRTIIERLKNKALGPDYQVRVYHSTGCADGNHGDAIMLAPPYIITEEEVQWIVQRITSVVNDFFDEYDAGTGSAYDTGASAFDRMEAAWARQFYADAEANVKRIQAGESPISAAHVALYQHRKALQHSQVPEITLVQRLRGKGVEWAMVCAIFYLWLKVFSHFNGGI